MRNSRKPQLYLYADDSCKTLSIREISSFLTEKLGDLEITLRPDYLIHNLGARLEEVSRKLASYKVKDPMKKLVPSDPFYGEIEYEKRVLEGRSNVLQGLMYDGFRFTSLLGDLRDDDEVTSDNIHISYSGRLLGTHETDGRYHARAIVCSFPSLISTSGIVEAPAKPKEFYLRLRDNPHPLNQALQWDAMKEEMKGSFIDFDDDRMTEVLKGYTLQAILYSLFETPFCDSKTCRLFNAHWQSEVLTSQLTDPEFCGYHDDLIRRLRQEWS